MEQAKYDVFISYSREDYMDGHENVIPDNEVSKILEVLTTAGITYWLDKKSKRGVLPGDEFAEIITERIKACKILVYISSTAANQSEWTKREIAYAVNCKKKIIPLLLDDSPYQDSVGLLINGLDRINYYNNPKKGLEDMIEAIKTHLDKLIEEERRMKEEMERQKEIERKKDEEMKRRREEGEKRQKELQEQLIKSIWTRVYELNKEETNLDVERSKLIVRSNEVTDIKQRDILKIEIKENSPIRKKSQAEIKKLQEHVVELETKQQSYVEKNDELLKKLSEKDSESKSLLKEIDRLRLKLQSSSLKQNRWLHIVYGLIILMLISVICFRLCSEKNDNGKISSLSDEPVAAGSVLESFVDSAKLDKQKPIVEDSIIEFRIDSVKFNMIKVEGGVFLMGASSNSSERNYDSEAYYEERPVHSVTLSRDYYIGETEVTQALWKTVMECEPDCEGGWKKDMYGKGNDYPAYNVSYNEIVNEFIPKLNRLTGKNFRLPLEAEWEYAARGGKKRKGCKYSGSNFIYEVAVYTRNSRAKGYDGSHSVKTKWPNELGLYDMSGNVFEWCRDSYGKYNSDSQTNPEGPLIDSDRVLRGGGWSSNARECRVSYRFKGDPDLRSKNIGFRLALSQ